MGEREDSKRRVRAFIAEGHRYYEHEPIIYVVLLRMTPANWYVNVYVPMKDRHPIWINGHLVNLGIGRWYGRKDGEAIAIKNGGGLSVTDQVAEALSREVGVTVRGVGL